MRAQIYLLMTFVVVVKLTCRFDVTSCGETMCIHPGHPGARSIKVLHLFSPFFSLSSAEAARYEKQNKFTCLHSVHRRAKTLRFWNPDAADECVRVIQIVFNSPHGLASRCVSISSGDGLFNLDGRELLTCPPPPPLLPHPADRDRSPSS